MTARPPVRVDNSILRIVAECSTQALVRYAHGYTSAEERAELRCGSAWHEAMAAYLTPSRSADALTVFAAAYREWAEEHVASNERLSWPNASRLLAAWIDSHPLASLPFVTQLVEVGFAFALADDVTFVGRLDGIGTGREDDARYVVEHKTTGNMSPWWLARYRMDSQFSGYILGAQHHLHGDKVVGAILNAVELRKLPDSDKRCDRHATPYYECGHLHAASQMIVVTRTPQQLVEWAKTALHLARRWQDLLTRFPHLEDIGRVRMQGMFNGACRGCPCQDWCAIDRPIDRLPTMMTYEPWEPYPVEPAEPAP